MPEYDLFLGLAEVAIVFAGFSGISVILSRRGPGGLSDLDALRIAIMVENSLVYALFALLPLGLWGVGLSGPIVWLICSAGLALYLAYTLTRIATRISRYYRAEPEQRDHPVWVAISFGGASAAIVVQCLNVFAVGFERTSGPFLSGLVVGLALSARLFVRSLSSLRNARSDIPE
jgi:hypothetical protein